MLAGILFSALQARASMPYPLPYTVGGVTYTHYFECTRADGFFQAYYSGDYLPIYETAYNAIQLHSPNVGYYVKDVTNYGPNWFAYGGANLGPQYDGNTSNLHSDRDVVKITVAYWQNPDLFNQYCGANNSLGCDSYKSADILPQLTVIINPQAGGTVAGTPGVLSCNNGTCTSTFSGSETLTATATDGWAFGRWDNGTTITDNPYTFSLSSNQTIYANFFRTFRNAVGNFYNTSGTYGDGECVTYVKHETGITTLTGGAFSGDAYTYYQEAIDNGYATGSTPRIGAIIVFDQVPNTSLEHGHVGVVTAISGTNVTMEDQNWVAAYTIGSHTVDVSQYAIKGYIYYTP